MSKADTMHQVLVGGVCCRIDACDVSAWLLEGGLYQSTALFWRCFLLLPAEVPCWVAGSSAGRWQTVHGWEQLRKVPKPP